MSSRFDETPEIASFLLKEPTGDDRGLAPHEVREVLEEAFDAARLRAAQAGRSVKDYVTTDTDLELHEKVLRRADGMQKVIEGGRKHFDDWCIDKGMHPGEIARLYDEVMAYIRSLTDASAEDHLATARARYDDLYERLVRRGELKEAASVQAKLDKLNQLGSGDDGDVLGGLARTIEKLSGPLQRPPRPS